MYISYLPDEMLDDFERGLQIGAEWGLHHVEVRLVDGVNVLDLNDAQVQRTKRLIDQYGMRVSGLATPFFKCPLPGTEAAEAGPLHGARELSYHDHLDLLPRGVEIARMLDAPVMRIFSFWENPQQRDRFWAVFPEAVDAALAAAAGSSVAPALENEGACFIGTSADLAEAARRLPRPDLKFIWDPGNSTRHGLPPRTEDVDLFFDRIALVHAKDGVYDASRGTSAAALIGEGETDYETELRRLHQNGYDGALALEPHFCPDDDCVEGMRRSLEALRAIAAKLEISLDHLPNRKVLSGRERRNIQIGSDVEIVQKQDQRTGKLTRGVVQRILTRSGTHPHGIKVQLASGEVGRVQTVLSQ